MPANDKVVSSLLLLFILFMFRFCGCVQLNKCCRQDEQFNEFLKCSKINEKANNSVSTKILPVDEKYDNYNFSSKIGFMPCFGKKNVMVKESSWFELDQHGLLSIYDENDVIVANYSRASYCVERWDVGDSEMLDIAYICPCLEHLCVMKCCISGKHMQSSNEGDGKIAINECAFYDEELDDWHHGLLNGSKISRHYETLSGEPECPEKYKLPLKGKYSLREDGSILSEFDGLIQPLEYCGDYLVMGDNGSDRISFILACVGDEVSLPQILVFAVFSGLSVLFLLIIVILHLWLPELSGIHGKCLVAHASCLAIGHLSTIPSQLVFIPEGHYWCYFIGYLMQFSFLASFFWLNIMCVDMSYTFSALRPTSTMSRKDKDMIKFKWYSVYAWGGAIAFTLAAIIVDFLPAVPSSSPFKPNLGTVKCWFNSTQSVLLYFYGPMGVLLVVNLFLFIYTTWRIIVMSKGIETLGKGDSRRHGGPSNKDKQRYILYAKMFSLMGVTWLTEIISWAIGGPSYFWYLTDFINLLRAVFIFIIFCWKPKVWNGIKRKCSIMKKAISNKLGLKTKVEEQMPEQSVTSTLSTECSSKHDGAEMKTTPMG